MPYISPDKLYNPLKDLSRFDPRYVTVMKGEQQNPRGFTPFQFSSRHLQMSTTQLGGLVPDNPISSLLNEATTWYEMWINPEKVNLSRSYQNKRVHTAGSIVTYHYRPEVTIMSISGVVGWIALNPQQEDTSVFTQVTNLGKAINKNSTETNKNSPRVFMKRIKDVADDPMYFLGTDGVEHYNTKYIKIYTKQYPSGIVCEGYFTKFEVPESGEDAQTINYTFEFVVEIMRPITELQKVSGMFGGMGGNVAGSTIRSLPGFF
ncbi:MAG TPA: hypothetical protein P5136_02305 [Methanofastidiosum sp.]|nr:hypothetical protein [Methanofastidiosum sp.]